MAATDAMIVGTQHTEWSSLPVLMIFLVPSFSLSLSSLSVLAASVYSLFLNRHGEPIVSFEENNDEAERDH